jgi:cardiolipin synthase
MPNWPDFANLANLLTLLRLLLVPVIIQAILSGRHGWALALFMLAGLTDALDGMVARRLGRQTEAGAYLDPIADKCLLSGIFLALALARTVPWWFVAIVFGRDLYILLAAAAIMTFTPVRKFPPSVWGKASTFIQLSTAVVWMVRNMLMTPLTEALAAGMLWVSAAFTIWSGIHYTWRGLRIVRVD